ncbi:MAG TPA: serine/threonine-protein kinase, partial [Solirubrobacteraceae bacterium]|nr:serine/threonine-protein kinase [Solirubrobacteraceae bacterium]
WERAEGAGTLLTEPLERRWPSARGPEGPGSPHLAEVSSRPTEASGQPTEELILGRYRLRRRLGTGGFASVWLARDERLERDVAVKLLAREMIVGGRFEREARATARLNHPGIVTLYEAAVDDEGAYLVSELVRGNTLRRLLHEGRLSDRDIGLAAMALCDALAYAHGQAVVHRDVKPSNILMPDRPHTTADLAKLTDFGVAHVIGGDSLTRTGDVIGTTAYMSPEQAEGREVEPSADLYSLAVVIYEALTGANPLRLCHPGVRGGRLGARLPPLRRQRRDLPPELGCAVDLALRPRPHERGSLADLREAVADSIDGLDDQAGIVALPPPRWTPGETAPRPGWSGQRPVGAPVPPDRERREPAAHDPFAPDLPGDRARPPRGRPAVPWPGRITAAAAAATATAWFTASLLSASAALPVVTMGAAALLVAALPRLGWLMLVSAGALALSIQGTPGAGLALVLAALPAVLLLFRRPTRWPLAASVPTLTAIGLAGLWPALAGRTATAWQRLILGGAGWVWLVAGETLGGSGVYVRLPARIPTPSAWTSSFYDTYHQMLHPVIFSGLLAPALVWALGALLLPHTDRTGPRVAAVLIWGLVVAGLSDGTLVALHTGAALRPLPALLGALACAGLAAIPDRRWAALRGHHGASPRSDSRSMETR